MAADPGEESTSIVATGAAGAIRVQTLWGIALILTVLGPLVCLPLARADTSGATTDFVDYAFAAYIGTGKYSVSGRTVHVYRVPISLAVRSVEKHSWGLRLRLTTAVGFYHFDINIVTQHAGSHVEQFQTEIDADTHIRSEDHADITGRIADRMTLLFRMSGGANDDPLACLAAEGKIVSRCIGKGEIDQHIKVITHGIQTVGNGDTEGSNSCHLSCITANQCGARTHHGGTQRHALCLMYGVNKVTTHAPHCANHCNSNHVFPNI